MFTQSCEHHDLLHTLIATKHILVLLLKNMDKKIIGLLGLELVLMRRKGQLIRECQKGEQGMEWDLD